MRERGGAREGRDHGKSRRNANLGASSVLASSPTKSVPAASRKRRAHKTQVSCDAS
jgi:hypothetical protein